MVTFKIVYIHLFGLDILNRIKCFLCNMKMAVKIPFDLGCLGSLRAACTRGLSATLSKSRPNNRWLRNWKCLLSFAHVFNKKQKLHVQCQHMQYMRYFNVLSKRRRMWIYIAHSRKKTFNIVTYIVTLVWQMEPDYIVSQKSKPATFCHVIKR